MPNRTSLFLLAIITAILLSNPLTSGIVFADNDNEKIKTLKSECAKKNVNTLEGLLCQAVLQIQNTIDTLNSTVNQLRLDVDEINNKINGIQNQDGTVIIEQTNPDATTLKIVTTSSSDTPTLQVSNSDGDAVFTVFPDGSVKIGAHSVTIYDNGTFSSTQPLSLPSGSTVGGELIATGSGGAIPAQSCPVGKYLSAIDTNGQIICTPLSPICVLVISRGLYGNSDYRGCDLSGMNLQNQEGSGSIFTGANLSGVNGNRISLGASILFNVNLSGATLRGLDAEQTYFNGANLTGADLQGGALRQTSFKEANLTGADLSETIYLDNADFSNANLSGANFSGSVMRYSILDGANLDGTNFDNADIASITAIGCIGTPIGIPANGEPLPTCTP